MKAARGERIFVRVSPVSLSLSLRDATRRDATLRRAYVHTTRAVTKGRVRVCLHLLPRGRDARSRARKWRPQLRRELPLSGPQQLAEARGINLPRFSQLTHSLTRTRSPSPPHPPPLAPVTGGFFSLLPFYGLCRAPRAENPRAWRNGSLKPSANLSRSPSRDKEKKKGGKKR